MDYRHLAPLVIMIIGGWYAASSMEGRVRSLLEEYLLLSRYERRLQALADEVERRRGGVEIESEAARGRDSLPARVESLLAGVGASDKIARLRPGGTPREETVELTTRPLDYETMVEILAGVSSDPLIRVRSFRITRRGKALVLTMKMIGSTT